MINLIKSELYRLFRSKNYKNCIIGTLGVTAFVLGLSIFTEINLWIMLSTDQDGLRRGFFISLQEGATFRQLVINALSSGAGFYIVAITLTTSIMVSRVRSGIMKNTVSYGYERWKIYLSQLCSLIIGISILLTSSVLTIVFITSIVFKPSNVGSEGIILLTKSLILYITIVAATTSVYSLLATVISNSEVMAVIVIVEILGVAMMIEPSFPTNIINCMPYSMVRVLAQLPEAMNFGIYFINSIAILSISIILGIIVFNKKEIK